MRDVDAILTGPKPPGWGGEGGGGGGEGGGGFTGAAGGLGDLIPHALELSLVYFSSRRTDRRKALTSNVPGLTDACFNSLGPAFLGSLGKPCT